MVDRPEENRDRRLSLEDLYRDWLGVTSPSPTYYDLLGVPPLERDATRILQAAREVKRKIRAYQIGRYRKQALDLLSDVGQAVSVLTNAARRQAYDNELLQRWREAIEALYNRHCMDRPHEPETLEAWLIACRESGVPVSRLIPAIMRFLRPQMDSWPARGEHGLNLPKGLWIYRDAVVLGSCLDDIPLERRAEAVKGLQKALGIPEGLARVVAEEVTQESRLLDRMSLVRQAQGDPGGTVLRMGWRIKRLGGRPDQRSKILSSVGALVGLDRRRIRVLLPRLDERPVVLPASRRAALAARTVGRRAHETGRQVRGWLGLAWAWLADRPQLLVAAAVLSGLVVLVLAVLVVAGVWKPWGPSTESKGAPPIESPPPPMGLPAPPEGPAESPPSDLEEWKEFMKKYPVEPGAVPPTPPTSVPARDREEPSADE